jgi:hypothetical protein
VNPLDHLPVTLSASDQTAILNAIAADSDVTQSPQWLLKEETRRRVLRAHTPSEIKSALFVMVPPEDEITKALRYLYVGPPPVTEQLTEFETKALISVRQWTEGHAPFTVDEDELRWHLARVERENEYRRLVSAGFFGREKEADQLGQFLTAPLDAFVGASGINRPKVHLTNVFGSGGIGKSTLVSAVAQRLLQSDPTMPLVHLDFDRANLDPTRTASLDLELLEQAGGVDRQTDQQLSTIRERIRAQFATDPVTFPNANFESAQSDSKSAMTGALEWLHVRRRPLLLIIDSFEQVESGGSPYIYALWIWLTELFWIGGAPEIRVIISGRSDLRNAGLYPDAATQAFLEVPELALDGAVQFLLARGVPAEAAKVVYETFGGNPLMLRLASELVASGDAGDLDQIAYDAREGKLPQGIVQGLLYDRFLRHIDAPGREYAHPGLILPEITRELIANVLGPLRHEKLIEDTQRTNEIFQTLAAASWLVSPSSDGTTLIQRHDFRQLMLKLMASDAERRAEVEKVRKLAIEYHHSRTGLMDRAFELYHQLMMVETRDDLIAFDGVDIAELAEYLRPHLDDLPEIVRSNVQSRLTRKLGAEEAIASLTDASWSAYLVGDGRTQGEGERIVEGSDPMIALNIWRRRPVRPENLIPTFVLEALGETADWEDPAADEATASWDWAVKTDDQARRLYWAARLLLLRDPSGLPGQVVNQLALLLERFLVSRIQPELVSLCVVAEATTKTQFIPEKIFKRIEFAADPRLSLSYLLRNGFFAHKPPNLDALVTIQRNWKDRLTCFHVMPEVVTTAQEKINGLHGGPLDAVASLYKELRTVEVPFDSDKLSPDQASLLLRGTTPEFYRPVRQALREAISDEKSLRNMMSKFRGALSVCPSDLEPDTFVPRAMREPAVWFLSLARFADRARSMETLLNTAVEYAPANVKLVKVRDAWVAWDRALCGGESSSAWTRSSTA